MKNKKYIIVAIIGVITYLVFEYVYLLGIHFAPIIKWIIITINFTPIWIELFFLHRDERISKVIRLVSTILVWWLPFNIILVLILILLGKAM